MLFKTIILLASSLSIFAQTSCPVFDGCLLANDQFAESTCTPLSNDATLLAQCTCYAMVNRANCYLQCPGVTEVSSLYAFQKSNANSQCRAAGLNSAALPSPPPWQTSFQVAADTADAGSAKPAGMPSDDADVTKAAETSGAERAVAVGFLFISIMVERLL
jgi:hypothetical protein